MDILLICLCNKLLKTILHEPMDIDALLFLLAGLLVRALSLIIFITVVPADLIDFLVRKFL